VPLYLGIPFTILIVAVAASIQVGSVSFEWLAAAGGAIWAVCQSRKYQLARFERLFPLEPLPLGITVLLHFPFTFPWFLRLRHRALRGQLPLRTGPSRLRLVLVGVVVAGGLLLSLAWGALRRTQPWRRLETSMQELQAAAGGSVGYEVSEQVLHLTVENDSLYRMEPLAQRDTARAIAQKSLAVVASSFGPLGQQVTHVEILFVSTPSRRAPRSESPRYSFPTAELE
jgi:hypothetical protein